MNPDEDDPPFQVEKVKNHLKGPIEVSAKRLLWW